MLVTCTSHTCRQWLGRCLGWITSCVRLAGSGKAACVLLLAHAQADQADPYRACGLVLEPAGLLADNVSGRGAWSCATESVPVPLQAPPRPGLPQASGVLAESQSAVGIGGHFLVPTACALGQPSCSAP